MVSRVSEAAFDPNGLLVQLNGAPVYGRMVTIASGQNLAKGAAVGQVTSGGAYILSLAAADDGSQAIAGVLSEACDATGGARSAFVYFTGEFNPAKMVFGTGHTATARARTLAQLGIFLHEAQPA